MIDSFGRTIDYLRLSVTGRCNLRCLYCMPSRGVKTAPRAEILSFEEIIRLIGVMAKLGITKIKITGGEALTRKGIAGLIGRLKLMPGITQVTLTSNGVLLDEHLDSLIAAGLDAVNISLDALNAETFTRLTRRRGFEWILAVLERCNSLPIPVKINCVPICGLNDGEIAAIAGLAKDSVAAVRFIELMPLGCAANYRPPDRAETLAAIESAYGKLTPFSPSLGNGPAVYYSLAGFRGKIGFISPLSHNFCESCNRLRLSAAGFLRPCLSADGGLDLRTLLRSSGSMRVTDEELSTAIQNLTTQKPRCHTFANPGAEQRDRQMFSIGG